jgi:hypothetical protein
MAAAALTLGRIDQRWLLRVLLFLAVTVAAAAIDLTNTARPSGWAAEWRHAY